MMTRTLALIHTSMVFITVETMMRDIFAEVMPDVRLINIVDDSLLPDVMETGKISPAVTRRSRCAPRWGPRSTWHGSSSASR
jgi:hypothetical protein